MRFSHIFAGLFLFFFLSSSFAAPKRDLVGGLVNGVVTPLLADIELSVVADIQLPGILNVQLDALLAGDLIIDGHLDILGITADVDAIIGRRDATCSGVPLFAGNGTCFSSPSIISTLVGGVISLTDINLDGFLDVLVSGVTADNVHALVVLQGDGKGNFIQINLDVLLDIDLVISAHVWGDLDLDGDLDLVIAGTIGDVAVTQIYLNVDAQLQLFTNITGLYMNPTIHLCDFNNDGFLDIMLTGSLSLNIVNPVTLIFRNVAGTAFLNVNAAITGVVNAAVSLGDINNDGWIDAVICGHTGTGIVAQVYLNQRGLFALLNVNLLGIVGDVALADFNNDGFLDIVLSGTINIGGVITKIYVNNGNCGFIDLGLALHGLVNPTLIAADINLDGLLDLAITGQLALGTPSTLVYLNAAVAGVDINAEVAIGAPTAIYSEWINNSTLKIYWPSCAGANSFNLALKAGVDIEANVDLAGIDINADIHIGPIDWIVSPLSVPALAGSRLVPGMGNAGGRTFSIINGLDSSLTYLFGVQSIAANYAASPFTWGCTGPDCDACQVCH